MSDHYNTRLLSDLVQKAAEKASEAEPGWAVSTRRQFLARASAMGVVLPGVASLIGCEPGSGEMPQVTQTDSSRSQDPMRMRNADSRLDTALSHEHGSSTGHDETRDASAVPFHQFDPVLPPLSDERTLRIHWRAQEVPVRISNDTVVSAWTFEGDIPGPTIHCRVGDTVEFTLTNEGAVPHSMDFHAAQIDPKHAFRSVAKGDSVSFTFKPKYAGAFLYHCGTAPVLMHIGAGMYGAIIVSPRTPLPSAREFVLVHSEYYLGDAVNGVRPFDYNKMLATLPDFLAFNGRPNAYIESPIRVKTGDRVRFWVVNAGPTHSCAFHVVGEQFDSVYLGAPPGNPIHGVQTWDVAAGGGQCFELVCDISGEFPFVNHGFGHGQKGAIGFLLVE